MTKRQCQFMMQYVRYAIVAVLANRVLASTSASNIVAMHQRRVNEIPTAHSSKRMAMQLLRSGTTRLTLHHLKAIGSRSRGAHQRSVFDMAHTSSTIQYAGPLFSARLLRSTAFKLIPLIAVATLAGCGGRRRQGFGKRVGLPGRRAA